MMNQKIADKRGPTVTVRSRSTVILSKDGKIEGGGGARSLYHDGSKNTPAGCNRTEDTRTGTAPGSLQPTRRRASTRAVRRLEGTFAAVTESEGEGVSRARHVPLESEGRQRNPAPKNKKGYPGDETTTPSTRCEQTPRRNKGQEREKHPVSDASSSRRVVMSLLQAENWLANNDEDTIEVEHQGGRRRGSGQSDLCAQTAETCARKASGISLASRDHQAGVQGAHQNRGVIRCELPGGSARLRGKAAAVWAAMEAQQKEEEEMTGTPEITRLGQSKHRSVDDLFLFQRNVEASRRHKQDERDTQEEQLVTDRPVSTPSQC